MNENRLFPVATGTVAALLLFAFYVVIVAVAEGRALVADQLVEDAPYFVFLFPGFAVQVGLYTHVRQRVAQGEASGAVTGTAGGVSTTAVVACCAHFIPTLLPVVGVSAISALLAAWKGPLLILAILANLAGIAYMIHVLRKHGPMLTAHGAGTS